MSSGSQNDVAIAVQNLGKCYHIFNSPQDRLKHTFLSRFKKYCYDFWALREINFEIRRGETVGVIGRNGAGKSTLLQSIAGTLTPTEGEVRVRGRVVALLELGSGFNPEFTGRENVYLYGSMLNLSKSFIDERFPEIARFADIGKFIDQPVKTYSSGMHARLAFSVAAFVDPEILIVDEILSVGDAAFQAKCSGVFHRLRDNGCTILLVSHDPYLIRNFCQRALYLREGRQEAFGGSDVVTDKYLMEIESKQMDDRSFENASLKEETSEHDGSGIGLFSITNVELLNARDEPVSMVQSGETIKIRFDYLTMKPWSGKVVFVFSLYRHDRFYVCGNTTLMDGIEPFNPGTGGRVEVVFPNIKLLAGNYVWRVAIDDDRGYMIYVEADGVCAFQVVDKLRAVGLVDLERTWRVTPKDGNGTD